MRGPGRWKAALLGVMCAGCYGGGPNPEGAEAETDSPGDSGDSGTEGGSDNGSESVALSCELGAQPKLRMLTRAELDASLRTTFGLEDSLVLALVPADPVVNGYGSSADALQMSDVRLEQLLTVVLDVTDTLVAQLDERLPCAATDPGEACAGSFIEETLPLLYRRPVQDAEVEQILAVYASETDAGQGFETAIGAAAAAMILAPDHLYRFELGDGVRMTSHEIADFLAFDLTGAPPDSELAALAEADMLGDPEVRRAQAHRLLDSAAGRARLVAFVIEWLRLGPMDNLSKAYPEFTPELRASWRGEVERFVEHVVYEDDGRLSTLLSASYTFVDAALADIHGINAPGAAEGVFVKVELPSHAGVLASAAVLATFAHPDGSSPVRRGLLVRERLLCQTLPPPPPSVDTMLPDDPELPTTRARTEAHVADPACRGCHDQLDPLGFAFESFDGLGRWRDEENGVAIDASGKITGTAHSDATFSDFAGLVAALSGSPDVRDCFVTNFYMSAMGAPVPYNEACAPDELLAVAAEADGNIVDLIAAWAALDSTIIRQEEQ